MFVVVAIGLEDFHAIPAQCTAVALSKIVICLSFCILILSVDAVEFNIVRYCHLTLSYTDQTVFLA